MTRRGFTLVEVMVALGILSLIALLSWTTIAGATNARDYLDAEAETERSARVALGRVTDELRLAFLTENTTAVNTYRTVFVSKDGDPGDTIWFSSLSHHRKYQGARECDQTEVTLWLEDDPEHSGAYVLLHREAQRIDEKPDEDGEILPIASNVVRFDLRFLDGDTLEWKDEWDTAGIETPNRLPRAVQVLLVLRAPDPADDEDEVERPYLTTVLLDTAKKAKSTFTVEGASSLAGGGPTSTGSDDGDAGSSSSSTTSSSTKGGKGGKSSGKGGRVKLGAGGLK